MAAGRAGAGRGAPGHAALACAALLLAPLLLRALALAELDATPAWGDARGVARDAGVAGLCLLALWWPARWLRGLAVLGVVLLTLVHYANYETVRALRAIADWSDIRLLTDATFVGGSVLAPLHPLLLLALLAAGGAAAWRGVPQLPGRVAAAVAGVSLVLLAGAALSGSDERLMRWRQVNVIGQNVAWQFGSQGGAPQSAAALTAVHAEFAGDLSGEPRVALDAARRNVLLVVLEGVSGAELSSVARAHGRHAAHPMGQLDAVFANNVGFTTFLNHNRRTDRGLYALLCGELPSLVQGLPKMTVGARGLARRCLPQRMREQGYATAYLQAAPLAFMAKDQFLPRAGFERVLGTDWFEQYAMRTLWGVDDRAFFAGATRLVEELQAADAPWFLTLLSVGTHHPYVVPAGAGAGAAFEHLDVAVGDFVAWLDAAGVREDTLVLLTSDESAGLWPGTADGVAQELTQNWGFLVALLPERTRARVDTPYAQADVALSVLDYVGQGEAAPGLHGRSLFRDYVDGRHLFFGNVNLRTLGALAPDGYLLHCREGGEACSGYDAFGGRMFAPAPRAVAPRPQLETLTRNVARASRPAAGEPAFSLALVEAARFELEGPEWQLVHGTPVALDEGEWLEVELEFGVVGEGRAEIEHALRFPRKRDALRAVLELEAGESFELRYSLAPAAAIPRITCQSQVRSASGGQVALELRARRLTLHRDGEPPGAGLVVERYAGAPAGLALPPLETLTAAEIDAVALSMRAGGAAGARPAR